MLNFSQAKIYMATGHTDMRKGTQGLAGLVQSDLLQKATSGALFVFRGKSANKIKILWWDGQGFCLFYKCLERGKFPWLNVDSKGPIGITGAQLGMLLEGVDWRNPSWSAPPERVC
jgi:transposase